MLMLGWADAPVGTHAAMARAAAAATMMLFMTVSVATPQRANAEAKGAFPAAAQNLAPSERNLSNVGTPGPVPA